MAKAAQAGQYRAREQAARQVRLTGATPKRRLLTRAVLSRRGAPTVHANENRSGHGIRQHRDSSLHELCWHHPALWGLLPETTDPLPVVPAWPQLMQGCVKYWQSLDEQAPAAPRTNEPYAK